MDRAPSVEHRLFSVRGLDPRLQQDLTEQFESVLAFADFCTYLTDGRVDDRAGRLRDLAQALHSDTTEDLQRGASRG
ncbi:MAG: hypothetical protein ACJ72A_21615 [Nocardioidaceae bacterium]|nr:hypothetical protein [Nocardioidaceae bacterium]